MALAVFGVTMAGLGSLALTQLRMMRALEHRAYCQAPLGTMIILGRSAGSVLASMDTEPGADAVLRSAEAWARRLGGGNPARLGECRGRNTGLGHIALTASGS